MALWIFMLLFLGISEASSFGENTDCFEECYANILTKQLPKLLARNEKTFTKEMKEDFYACAEREMKRCGWWDFGSSKETQSVCDSVAGCTEGEDETGNKYSFLHCLDEHRPDLVVCYANYILEFMEAVVKGEKIQEPEDVYMFL
nr:uncharacterized protein LOC107452066 isoform X2 [Parasteatoda tepidariorum]